MKNYILILTALFALLFSSCVFADAPASGSQTYYNWLQGSLKAISKDMPNLTKSAESAAKSFVKDDYSIGAWGDRSFASEFYWRSGGLMSIQIPIDYDKNLKNSIILICPRENMIQQDVMQAQQWKKQGNIIILFARKNVINMIKRSKIEYDYIIDNHGAENGGLLKATDGRYIIPTEQASNLAALWAWNAEFVSACTRLGKMPVIWQSIFINESEERNARYSNMKFHDEKITPIRAGVLGKEYIAKLATTLKTIYAENKVKINSAAKEIDSAITDGKKAYVEFDCSAFMDTAAPETIHANNAIIETGSTITNVKKVLASSSMEQKSDIYNTGYFQNIAKHDDEVNFQQGSIFLCMGYVPESQTLAFGKHIPIARKAGAKIIWSLTTHQQDKVDLVEPEDVLIDQKWLPGDAIVDVPGYDVDICPSSGVIAETVFWMINSEIAVSKGATTYK